MTKGNHRGMKGAGPSLTDPHVLGVADFGGFGAGWVVFTKVGIQ
jgi:hypothetical protein